MAPPSWNFQAYGLGGLPFHLLQGSSVPGIEPRSPVFAMTVYPLHTETSSVCMLIPNSEFICPLPITAVSVGDHQVCFLHFRIYNEEI